MKIDVSVKKLKVSNLKTHEENPRIIKDKKYKELKKSIEEFGEMLDIREIVVDENNIVLGGNMRLRVLQELNLDEVTVKQVKGLTEQQKREFVIKDNVSFGQWDWDLLGNEWEAKDLNNWGLDVWIPEEAKDFEPTYTPKFDNKELKEEDFKDEDLREKVKGSKRDYIDCICPNCYTEFKVEAK